MEQNDEWAVARRYMGVDAMGSSRSRPTFPVTESLCRAHQLSVAPSLVRRRAPGCLQRDDAVGRWVRVRTAIGYAGHAKEQSAPRGNVTGHPPRLNARVASFPEKKESLRKRCAWRFLPIPTRP